MRTLRLLLAVGLSLAPALAAAAAGTVPAFAGGGAGMTLTAAMDGQDQRLLAGTKHLVHITLADTPGEADLRDITISLTDLDPHPLTVDCPDGQNGHLSLEPEQSLHCTSLVTAGVGFRTLVVRATAVVPSGGTLLRTAPLHYTGFLPPDPPPPAAARHPPLDPPDPAAGRTPRAPVSTPRPPLDPPALADPPLKKTRHPVKAPAAPVAPVAHHGCAGETGADAGCCADSQAEAKACCGSTGKSGTCGKHGGLAFTGLSTPMLTAATGTGLLLVAGGFFLVRRFSRR